MNREYFHDQAVKKIVQGDIFDHDNPVITGGRPRRDDGKILASEINVVVVRKEKQT